MVQCLPAGASAIAARIKAMPLPVFPLCAVLPAMQAMEAPLAIGTVYVFRAIRVRTIFIVALRASPLLFAVLPFKRILAIYCFALRGIG